MKTFRVAMNDVQFDDSKKYFDFYKVEGEPVLVEIDLVGMLEKIVAREIPVDTELKSHMQYLSRWTTEAPRKRASRMMRRVGMIVVTTDVLFEEDGGEAIIDNLENTGNFAEYFLKEVYGVS